jgi:hypothetical protein
MTQWLESRGTHNPILLSHLRLPNLEGQVSVFISLRNRIAQLYPRELGSIFVASYDSQGYGGGILTPLHTGELETNLAVVYEAHPQSKFPWGRVQKQNTMAWKYLLQQI